MGKICESNSTDGMADQNSQAKQTHGHVMPVYFEKSFRPVSGSSDCNDNCSSSYVTVHKHDESVNVTKCETAEFALNGRHRPISRVHHAKKKREGAIPTVKGSLEKHTTCS